MSKILIIAEHEQKQIKQGTLSCVGFAQQALKGSDGSFEILILGHEISKTAEDLLSCGAAAVLTADHPALLNPVADKYAQVISQIAQERKADMVVAAASTFSKDILPRTAGLLDAVMASDIVAVQPEGDTPIFKRVMFAGNVIATVKLEGACKVLTIRSSAFPKPEKAPNTSSLTPVTVDENSLPSTIEFNERQAKAAGRPDATEARIVVSGGRALKNSEEFEKLIGGLADVLGAAVGSSRALVDGGITPNSLQIGQTGKVVAPDLYIAVGISGAIQHLAGMKDSKVIVAINKDPEAPIFEIADYGLVGDVYQIIPELTEKMRK